MPRFALAQLLALTMVTICSCGASKPVGQGAAPLIFEKAIPLPETKGRIDREKADKAAAEAKALKGF